MGINESGSAVGLASTISGDTHGFLYSAGKLTDLGTLGGTTSWAWDVNELGWVVGEATTASGATHAFLDSGGGMIDLNTLGGTYSRAYGINESGKVVGGSANGSGSNRAFLYTVGGGMTDLGTLGGSQAVAVDINDSGLVVGQAALSTGAGRAVVWIDGRATNLSNVLSMAQAINSSGQIVGYAYNLNNVPRATLFSVGGAPKDLGVLAGGYDSYAYDINDSGTIVGNCRVGGVMHAFLYGDGKMSDLDGLLPAGSGWQLQSAQAINNRNQIVGMGSYQGTRHAFLLAPNSSLVPTPNTCVALVGMGIFVAIRYVWRRLRRSA